MPSARPIVVLLTDFGGNSPYVGAMKGALLAVSPGANLVDLSHGVPAQDVESAAWLLRLHYDSFPPSSVFVAVVDPGVGSDRRRLVARAGERFFLAPDNGLLSGILQCEPDREIRVLENEAFWREQRSATFHGRDIFAPAAAYLAGGAALAEFGRPCDDPVRLEMSAPVRSVDGLAGRIVLADDFGNLITDIGEGELSEFCREMKSKPSDLRVDLGGRILSGLSRIYAEAPGGEAIALIGSSGQLEIAINRGNAREELGLEPGASVRLFTPAKEVAP